MSGGKLDCLYSGQQQRSVALSRRGEAAVCVCVYAFCVYKRCCREPVQVLDGVDGGCACFHTDRFLHALFAHTCVRVLRREGQAVPVLTRSPY